MKIHQASLEVLEEEDVRFEDDQVFDLLAEHCCRVDPETKVTKIPGRLVEDGTKKCPPEFTLRARNPEKQILPNAAASMWIPERLC